MADIKVFFMSNLTKLSKGKIFFKNLEDHFFRSSFNECDTILEHIFKKHQEIIESNITAAYKYYKKRGFVEGFHKSFRQADILPCSDGVNLDIIVWQAIHGSKVLMQALKEL